MANKTDLVIVESPSKAKTIGKYLGPGYEVKASMGHVRDLPKSKLGVDVSTFEPDYENIKDKADVIKELRRSAKASDKIYLATDPDREGEAISWHLQSVLGVPKEKTCRVTFNEITQKVVKESIANPRDIDQDLVDAQQARRVLDRIVGYQLSPCCGGRSGGACLPDGCSRWPLGWRWNGRRKSEPSLRRNIGRSPRPCPALPPIWAASRRNSTAERSGWN